LAHLGLARAYAMQKDTVKARATYQDFLTLWKDACSARLMSHLEPRGTRPERLND